MGVLLSKADAEARFKVILSRYIDSPAGYHRFIKDNPWAISNDSLPKLIFQSWDKPTFKANVNAKKAMQQLDINTDLNHSEWKPQSGKNNTEIIRGYITFLVKDYLGIDINHVTAKDFLNYFNNHGILEDAGHEKWMDRYYLHVNKNIDPPFDKTKEFTKLSHCLFSYFPGKDWLIEKDIDPLMFNQAVRNIAIDEDRAVSLLEKLYISHLDIERFVGIPRISPDFVIEAKKTLILNPDIYTKKLANNIISTRVFQKLYSDGISFEDLIHKLTHKFKDDDGVDLTSMPNSSWSPAKFKRDNPDNFYSYCIMNKLACPQLHHLVPRAEYPQYSYEKSNVIPINASFHRFIERKCIRNHYKIAYGKAIKEWLHRHERGESSIDIFMPIIKDMYDEYLSRSIDDALKL